MYKRQGLGTVLKEIADQSQVGIKVEETAIPIHEEVQSVCNISVSYTHLDVYKRQV